MSAFEVASNPPKGSFRDITPKHVKINEEGVEKLSEELFSSITDKLQIPKLGKEALLLSRNDHRLVDWVFVVDSLNFCFWSYMGAPKWTVNGHGGYFALEAAMKRAMEISGDLLYALRVTDTSLLIENKPLYIAKLLPLGREGYDITNPEFYSKIPKEQLSHILRGDNEAVIPLFEERLAILHEVGNTLLLKYKGTFKTVVRKANKCCLKLLDIVIRDFPCFKDEAIYQGYKLSFYKRAQILAADLWNLFNGKKWGDFRDIDKLTMFADYRVPQVLVYFGVLSYNDQLMKKLENDELLPNGSEEEIEIRSASIEAVEQIKHRIEQKIKDKELKVQSPNSMVIDYYLWCYRRKHATEMERIPFHKTLSIFY